MYKKVTMRHATTDCTLLVWRKWCSLHLPGYIL